jgi:parallel beta helix pectate lyase-like protein
MWRCGLTSVCLGLLCAAPVQAASNLITGTITANATWSDTNLLRGTVIIAAGVTVNIEPGTRMLMNTNAVLQVNGQLLANGTSNAPILFTRATTTAPWSRIILDRAAPSRLRYCIIEYANSAGNHQDYYPRTGFPCNPPTFATRVYHEAVVCLAGRLDVEGCTFRNLAAAGDGDAIAIISDHPDPLNTNSWNSASGTVRNSRFLSIGQGVHTRYAYVLVEDCFFSGKNGDNDHVDLFGESDPPAMIRNNYFNPQYEDAINPTRCSAIIMNNIVVGAPDHGIVLRDVCKPIVINNYVANCGNGGITVQNGCDALILNNTIVNCNRAIKLFDHLDRTNAPYCLARVSGRATVINNIIWNSTPAFDLGVAGSAISNLYVNVSYSDIQGGTNNSALNATAILIGGPGNINADPLLVNIATTNFHLRAGSPCIDAGTNLSLFVSNDLEFIPRPLDGNGDGSTGFDMGAHEFLLASADSNGDGIPDGWTWSYRLNPAEPNVGSGNPDGDPHTTFQEWIADTNPTNAASHLRIQSISLGTANTVSFISSSNRNYTLFHTPQIPATWSAITTQAGKGGPDSLSHTNSNSTGFYKIGVALP